jgi:MFS superfamily sulfate permease-like transporter
VAAILLAGGLLRLGFVADLLSKPIRIGYLNGVVLVVIVGQFPALLGFAASSKDGLVDEAGDLVDGVADGRTRPAAAAIGTTALALILVASSPARPSAASSRQRRGCR